MSVNRVLRHNNGVPISEGQEETMLRFVTTTLVSALVVVAAAQAQAQTPTAAQRDALRSNCASDFRANCQGVSPGGMGALICLEQNEAKLSAGCKGAVDAVKGPHTEAAPKPAQSTATARPAETQARSEASPSAQPARTASEARPAAAPGDGISLRQEVRVGARACFGDFNRFCPNLPMGQGNMVRCLKEHARSVSPRCHNAMAEVGSALR